MLDEALAALASTSSAALVTAMVTDGWEGLRNRIARLLGRGDARGLSLAAARLEQSRERLVSSSGAELDRVRAEQETDWRTQLEDLLEHDPGAAQELRNLLAEIQARGAEAAGRVELRATAYDQAQQAVLGRGVQHVHFGGHRESGPSR
jgi:hypothetical protein